MSWLGAVQILGGESGSGEGYEFCLSAEGRVVGLSRFQETDFYSFCIHILFHSFLVTFISSKKWKSYIKNLAFVCTSPAFCTGQDSSIYDNKEQPELYFPQSKANNFPFIFSVRFACWIGNNWIAAQKRQLTVNTHSWYCCTTCGILALPVIVVQSIRIGSLIQLNCAVLYVINKYKIEICEWEKSQSELHSAL